MCSLGRSRCILQPGENLAAPGDKSLQQQRAHPQCCAAGLPGLQIHPDTHKGVFDTRTEGTRAMSPHLIYTRLLTPEGLQQIP